MADAAASAGLPPTGPRLAYTNPGRNVPGVRGGGAGGGGDETSGIDMREYVDAQDEKTRAQNDARFSEVLAELKIMRETSASLRSVWGAAAATFVAIGGLLIGVLAIGGDRFESGIGAGTLVNAIEEKQEKRDAEQDETLGQILAIVEQLRDDSQVQH